MSKFEKIINDHYIEYIIPHFDGKIISCKIGDIEDLGKISELKEAGIYFAIGKYYEEVKKYAYFGIGTSVDRGVWGRAKSHPNDFKYATEIFFYINKKLHKEQKEWIENESYIIGKEINNYIITNKRLPSFSSINECDISYAKECFEKLKDFFDIERLYLFTYEMSVKEEIILEKFIDKTNLIKKLNKNFIEEFKKTDIKFNDKTSSSQSHKMTNGDTHLYYTLKEKFDGFWKESNYKPKNNIYNSYNRLITYDDGVNIFEKVSLKEIISGIEVPKSKIDVFEKTLINNIDNNIRDIFHINFKERPNKITHPSKHNVDLYIIKMKEFDIHDYENYEKYFKIHIEMSNKLRNVVEYIRKIAYKR